MYKHIIEKNLHIIERLFNNKQIGICNFMFQNNVCYINNIEINQNYRNKKNGTELLRQVEEYSKNNNIKYIQVNIRQMVFGLRDCKISYRAHLHYQLYF